MLVEMLHSPLGCLHLGMFSFLFIILGAPSEPSYYFLPFIHCHFIKGVDAIYLGPSFKVAGFLGFYVSCL